MALRVQPRVGSQVQVTFLDATARGAVRAIRQEGRELDVETVEGELLTFILNRATARFTLNGELSGARLTFAEHTGTAQLRD